MDPKGTHPAWPGEGEKRVWTWGRGMLSPVKKKPLLLWMGEGKGYHAITPLLPPPCLTRICQNSIQYVTYVESSLPACTDSSTITGRSWAATSTEGLLIYSLDHNLVFDPYDLEMEITPNNVKKTLQEEEYSTAVMLAFRLNEHALIQEVVENIPVKEGENCLICVFGLDILFWLRNIPLNTPKNYLLPTTYVVGGKVMFSQLSAILFCSGGGEGGRGKVQVVQILKSIVCVP